MKSKNSLPENLKLEFIINEYTKSRGEPKFLKVCCSSCNNLIIIYQKDGPGPLLRCYFDRIHYPNHLKNLEFTDNNENLICENCKKNIGKKIVYIKENRLSFHLNQDSFYLLDMNDNSVVNE